MSAQGHRRPSWEILSDLFKHAGHKQVAYQLHLNLSLVYEWAKEPEGPEEMMNSGRRNPLDRTREMLNIAMTNGRTEIAVEILNWLAAELGGVYVADDQLNALKRIVEAAEEQAKHQTVRRVK
jgi:hypothetical protein